MLTKGTSSRSSTVSTHSQRREGSAIVEMAVTIPLLVLLVFGAIDAGRAIHVQHNLTEAARAGARMYASQEEVTEQQAKDMVKKSMEEAGLQGFKVILTPERPFTHMQPVTCTVSLEYSKASWFNSLFFGATTLKGRCVMPADSNE